MRKFSLKKHKWFILVSLFSVGFLSAGIATAAYVVSDQEKSVEIGSLPVNVIDIKQDFLTYLSNNKIIVDNNNVLSDTLSMYLTFNGSAYEVNSFLYNHSFLHGPVSIPDESLFNYLETTVKFDFLSISYNDKEIFLSNSGDSFIINNEIIDTLIFDSLNQKIEFNIPFSSVTSGNANFPFNFYLRNLNNNDAPWTFSINLNFNVINESLGYSASFNWNNFSSISIILELFRY